MKINTSTVDAARGVFGNAVHFSGLLRGYYGVILNDRSEWSFRNALPVHVVSTGAQHERLPFK